MGVEQDNAVKVEQTRKSQDELQWIVAQRLLSHLQYLDSLKSYAEGLSLPKSAIDFSQKAFSGMTGSWATRPRPNACLVSMEVVDNTA